jgi:Chaperone of endosialidase
MSILNAITAGAGGVSLTGDTSGNLTIQSAGSNVANFTSSGPIQFFENGSEIARFDSSGNLLVGTTTAPNGTFISKFNSRGIQVENNQDTTKWRQMVFANNSADAVLYFPNGTNTASLSAAGAWTNASDGRQKTNVTDIKYGLQTVLEAKPHNYNRTDVEGDFIGFVAQELKTVIPEVVIGSEETSYGVDYGSLVAVAFKAIQELKALVDTQATEIAALKAKVGA